MGRTLIKLLMMCTTGCVKSSLGAAIYEIEMQFFIRESIKYTFTEGEKLVIRALASYKERSL